VQLVALAQHFSPGTVQDLASPSGHLFVHFWSASSNVVPQ
jgi:hypothetical protein